MFANIIAFVKIFFSQARQHPGNSKTNLVDAFRLGEGWVPSQEKRGTGVAMVLPPSKCQCKMPSKVGRQSQA